MPVKRFLIRIEELIDTLPERRNADLGVNGIENSGFGVEFRQIEDIANCFAIVVVLSLDRGENFLLLFI